MITFTEDDVRAAHLATSIRQMAKVEKDTPERIIRGYIDSGDQRQDRQEYQDQLALFQRGCTILDAGYHVSYSDRSVVAGDLIYEQVEQRHPVSPVVKILAGHIATSEAYRYMALVRNQ